MVKLLDLPAATDFVRRAARGRVTAGIGATHEEGMTLLDARFSGPAGELALAPDEQLDLLVPARGERGAIERLEGATGTSLPSLPLPLYVWGLDSI